jgi:hypothetical protein
VYTPISNKPPPGKPFTIYSIYFSATLPLRFAFLQRHPSTSSGCINRSTANLWVPFYRIVLGFNLRLHRWGFVKFFIHPLSILARSTSFRTNSCCFSFYHQFIQLNLDLVDFHCRSWFWLIRVLTSLRTIQLISLLMQLRFDRFRATWSDDRSVWGSVDCRSWLWWVIDNVVWTDSWASIACAGCTLICVGACEERARKVYALRGLRGVERQVGLARWTWWAAGWSASRMVAKKQDEVEGRSRCRVAAHNQSLCTGFAAVHHKTIGLLDWATKPRPEARRVETGSGRSEKLRCWRTRGGIAGLASGGRGLRRWRGRAMKRSATWPICP